MFYQDGLYQKDMVTLKSYAGRKFKVTLHRALRQEGFEDDREFSDKGTVNDEKLDCNISRARSKIFEYAFCNEWEWFSNLTLDRKKYNRFDLQAYVTDLTEWIRNLSKRKGLNIKYLFIPEQHEDGAWHIHGLMKGIPEDEMTEFIPGVHPQKLIDGGYLNWPRYQKKFGFCSFGKVKSHEAVSKYITKYVTKTLAKNNLEVGSRMYYCSKGLEEAREIKRGSMAATMNPDYENDYVKVKWLDDLQIALAYIRD